MSKIKALAGETALYGLGSIVPRALNFLLVPLHTRIFAPEQFGVITNLLAYVAFLNIVFTFGMETAYFRFATKPGSDPRRVFNLVQTIVLCISGALSIGLITAATPIAAGLHIPDHANFIIWLVLVMLLDAIVAIPFAELRLQKRPLRFALAKILNVLIIIALNWYFLKVDYHPAVGVGYVFLANLIANGVYIILFARLLFQWRPAFDSILSPQILGYAYPVMLTGLAGMTNEMFSRLTLEWWLPAGYYGDRSQAYALGVFGACYKYAVIMSVAIQAFRYAAEPFFFSNAAEKNSPQLFARVNHYFVIIACLLWLGVSINMDIFQHLLGSTYLEGVSIVPILLLAYLFLGLYYNYSVWFKVTDMTYAGTVITVGGAVLTIALNYLLVPLGGYTGSSWAALLVYFVMAMLCMIWGQRHFPIPYSILADFTYIAVTGILIYMVTIISFDNVWVARLFHVVIIGAFMAISYFIELRRGMLPAINKASGRNT